MLVVFIDMDYVVGITILYELLKLACLYKNSPETVTPGKLAVPICEEEKIELICI